MFSSQDSASSNFFSFKRIEFWLCSSSRVSREHSLSFYATLLTRAVIYSAIFSLSFSASSNLTNSISSSFFMKPNISSVCPDSVRSQTSLGSSPIDVKCIFLLIFRSFSGFITYPPNLFILSLKLFFWRFVIIKFIFAMLPQRIASHHKIRQCYLVVFFAIPVNKNKIAMLRTIEKDVTNPERQTHTSVGTKRPRKKVGFGSPEPKNRQDWGTISSFRPRTTPLITRNINQTLNTTARSSNLVHLRSISLVQSELNDRYKEDMNPYLRKKLRRFVERKQENFVNERPFESTIDSNEWDSTGKHSARRPIQQFYSSFHVEGKPLLEKGVDEAYLLTAKERIVRLIQMKKQRENQYKSLSSKIKAQRASNQEQKGKNRFEQFKKQTIEEEQWDQKWREDLTRQNSRYRNRLIVKCTKQNSPFFNLLH